MCLSDAGLWAGAGGGLGRFLFPFVFCCVALFHVLRLSFLCDISRCCHDPGVIDGGLQNQLVWIIPINTHTAVGNTNCLDKFRFKERLQQQQLI